MDEQSPLKKAINKASHPDPVADIEAWNRYQSVKEQCAYLKKKYGEKWIDHVLKWFYKREKD
ncbi:MAG TPA: hypothetical protein ENI27_05350 [bacterium]|nr:hypothetical protein [bacterium]